jgi:hypothetical protein
MFYKRLFLATMLGVGMSGIASGDIVNFDDLGGLLDSNGYYYNQVNPVGFQTQGFQFDMALMKETAFQTDYANTGGFPSSDIAVYANDASEDNNPFDEVSIYRLDGRRFNFLGAQIGGFTFRDTIAYYAATQLTITGYRDGNAVGTITADPLAPGYNETTGTLANVDKLVFSAVQGSYDYTQYGLTNQGDGSYYMMDNFKYSIVPAPGAVLLGLMGCGAIGAFRRRLA